VREANIPQAALYQSMLDVCTDTEIEYIRDLHQHAVNSTYGLAVCSSKPTKSIMDRFSAMAATCLRNYVSAKVMTLQDVLAALDDGDMPQPSVLLIPNFFVGAQSGGKIADWLVPPLTGMLYNRASAGLQTVVYLQYLKGLETVYGPTCAQHIAEHYVKALTEHAE